MPLAQWNLLDSGPGFYAFNMALDEALLESSAAIARPTLRFYGWTEPVASFGYFQKYSDIARMTLLRPLVRRPTGGGLVPHDGDWTYTLVFPADHSWHSFRATETYRQVHTWIRDAFRHLGLPMELAPEAKIAGPGQCFIGYEKSDVLFHGQKIAGAAQRRRRDGLLIQGSVQPEFIRGINQSQWHEAFCREIAISESIEWKLFTPAQSLLNRAGELVQIKYSTEAYNRRR